MSESEIIQVEYEAIKKFCQGDRKLALRVIQECGETMRNYFKVKSPLKVTSDELCGIIEAELKVKVEK
ncbi:MAG: hypothetical protein A3I11_06915 [Elusimicrobia bacterium RIFCSPLOWO2_02_FULL_39_32]|nr:MAG: hypothetical protein A3B80_05710 [Elusimicrobia bacterium RIFCSPHIGHO2_02_FULL_39_36]OGR91918.1 MAG: hypothetical protein A3I11_06915 [Elusimicrobia bacterium RIFCSPLOWO2_02_FULL_39_32]OGR98788.1 MAG: hypothetical protein A3G85_05515 [Elusimicrobia bacterium RIFCSPLOWO2_12_FULL_39_28]